jgi:diguanylate cyclase (GGDEF)-like protein
VTSESRVFQSSELAGRREQRFAFVAILVSGIIFLAAAPFAGTQLGELPAFVPAYVSALIICDLITAVLLFGQFSFFRSRGLLFLASAYAFTACMTISYVMMFPGLFPTAGLMGAGPQSTSAMYIFWHAGFPLLVMGYALAKDGDGRPSGPGGGWPKSTRLAIAGSIAAIVLVVVLYTILVTAGQAYLPPFLAGNKTTDLGHAVLAADWILSLVALAVLWRRRRPHTVIHVWLMVVMCVWLCDMALAAILNTGRYDLGWYGGRVYGLLAASGLLVMLLIENASHYARLVRVSAELSDANAALEKLSMQDGLTGIANRRWFDTYLAGQVAIARRQQRDVALVLCDVDWFKAYNDQYGHQAGDDCLKRVAAALRACCRRPADMAARYGGEEFALILPDTGMAGARRIAEAARQAIEKLGIPHGRSRAGPCITISGGLAMLFSTADATEAQLIAAADAMLFKAKRLGRNRMVVAQPESHHEYA